MRRQSKVHMLTAEANQATSGAGSADAIYFRLAFHLPNFGARTALCLHTFKLDICGLLVRLVLCFQARAKSSRAVLHDTLELHSRLRDSAQAHGTACSRK